MAWITLAIAGAGSLIGAIQRRSASSMEERNARPVATVNPLIAENNAIARRMAQVGMPSEQYQLAQNNINLQTVGALNAFNRSGRLGSLSSILRQSTQAQLSLDANNSAVRQANQRMLMQSNAQLAGEQQRVWGWNEQQRYLQQMQLISQLRQAGNQNIVGSLGYLAEMEAMGNLGNSQTQSGSSGQTSNNMFGNLFNRRRSTTTSLGSTYPGGTY